MLVKSIVYPHPLMELKSAACPMEPSHNVSRLLLQQILEVSVLDLMQRECFLSPGPPVATYSISTDFLKFTKNSHAHKSNTIDCAMCARGMCSTELYFISVLSTAG